MTDKVPTLQDLRNLVDVLTHRARVGPSEEAFTFLADGEGQADRWTYAQLDERAREIAVGLRDRTVPGDRVLLVFPPGVDYIASFFGCLYAGVIAVPTYAARLTRASGRLERVLADSSARVVLTTERMRRDVPASLSAERGVVWMSVDSTEGLLTAGWSDPETARESIAFLQYTSGSTSEPRGVMVSHANLLHNLEVITEKFGTTSSSRGIIWLPPYHDMGLIGGLLQPIFGGYPVTLMPPLPFIQRPFRWLKAISDFRGTHSGGPNFAYDLCVDRITEHQRAGLDLSSWELAFNGAEPIREATLERFVRTFGACGFRREAIYPCYGLAESTLLVTGARRGQGAVVAGFDPQAFETGQIRRISGDEATRLVSSGLPAADQSVAIVEIGTHRLAAPGTVGEICTTGPSVAGGYWNRPDASQEVFAVRIEGMQGVYLRTGDLGFVDEGELFVTGRHKDLIIVRGTNHYPQDIEATAGSSHESLSGLRGAAFSVDVRGVEQLVIVHEIADRGHADLHAIASSIARRISEEHELSVGTVVLVGHHRVPKTSSGKIQRYRCRQQFTQGSLEGVLATWTPAGGSESSAATPIDDDVSALGSEFFSLLLDPMYMVDSAAIWESADSLVQAQVRKFERLADLGEVRANSDLLDVGCGWGGFLRFASDSIGVRRAHGVTPSSREADHVASGGGVNVAVTRTSWESFREEDAFDAVVCAGALEHFVSLTDRAGGRAASVYRRFFQRCRRWLRGSGRMVLEVMVSTRKTDTARAYQDVSTLSRMFPHSSIPTMEELTAGFSGRFELLEARSLRRDYEKTLEAWLRNLHENRETIVSRFGQDVFDRFDHYLEASLRQATGGYVDLMLVSLSPLAVGPDEDEEIADQAHALAAPAGPARSADEIRDWLMRTVAARLDVEPSDVDPMSSFSTFGLDSLSLVSLVGEMETWLGRSLPPTLGWDYPTIELLAEHLSSGVAKVATSERKQQAEPIAIIGMGCRFPGARTLDDYWRLMTGGQSGVVEVPRDRWNIDEYFDKDPDAAGKMVTRWGGFVDGIDQFDPSFFGISPREAARMDPQQRLLLEVTWEALEHAGLPADRVSGSKTGVFVGIGGTDYSQLYRRFDNAIEYLDAYCGTGNALSIAANRLSYVLDLHGPSLSVDTACSSALVAIHYATQSLRQGDCDLAIAGGVNAILSPEVTIAFSKARMLSPDGQCKSFDADANGYVRGEGCGVVIFKRLADAVRDGDQVLAVLLGTAVNQDGRTTGITAPNGPAQQECVRQALAQAGRSADEYTYIEAHGTGTPLGDPIEVGALRDVVGQRSATDPVCYMGSVKSNIGHLETASGVAGLIRVVLMLQRGQIPPQRNFKRLNPHIKLDGSPIRIATEPVTWTGLSDGRRVAGVSGFGFGGTNAHLVVENYRQPTAPEPIGGGGDRRPIHVAVLSAQSETALRESARRLTELLDREPSLDVADVCHATATTRTPLDFRLAVEASTTGEMASRLTQFVEEGRGPGVQSGPVRVRHRAKIAMLFTGQGSQYAGMARELYQTQRVVRRVLDASDEILRPTLEHSLLSVLFDPSRAALIDTTTYTQPALFAVEYALAELWRSWGIEPTHVLGHSVGEFVAATVAGVMSFEDGLRLIAERARLMGALPTGGTMAVVFAGESDVAKVLAERGGSAGIAAVNGPENTVVSGPVADVERVAKAFEARGIRAQLLSVSHAFHSSLLDPMLDPLEAFAETIAYREPTLGLVSNVTGTLWKTGERPSASYWRQHARQAVRFADGMQALAKLRCDVYLEVGPHPSLIAMGRRCVKPGKQLWAASLRKGSSDWQTLAGTVGALFLHGTPVDGRAWDEGWQRRAVSLPTYPFQRQRYWMEEDPEKKSSSPMGMSAEGGHPLLGVRVPIAVASHVYATTLSMRTAPSLKDHVVQGSIVLPGAAYVESGLAAARELFGPGPHLVESMKFQQALFLPEGRRPAAQVVLSPEVAGSSSLQFLSLAGESAADATWTLHAEGVIRRGRGESTPPARPIPFAIRDGVEIEHTKEELYEKLRERGMEYGELFRITDHIWKRGQETLSRLILPAGLSAELSKFQMHPAILDACIQMLGATIPEELVASGTGETYLPTGVAKVRLFGSPEQEMWVHAVLHTDFESEGLSQATGDIWLLDDAGQVIVELLGVHLTRIGTSTKRSTVVDTRSWLYETTWTPIDDVAGEERIAPQSTWLLFGDDVGVTTAMVDAIRLRQARPIVVVPGREFARTNSGYRLRWHDAGDFRRLLAEVADARVMYSWGLRTDFGRSPTDSARPSSIGLLHLVQAIEASGAGPRDLTVVTRGALAVEDQDTVDPAQTALWGLGRVVANERLDLTVRLVDVDPIATDATCAEQGLREALTRDDEREVAYRSSERRGLRLTRRTEAAPSEEAGARQMTNIPSSGPYRLEIGTTPTLDRLAYKPFVRRPPGPGEVEIEVLATGLNFSDVLKAMGLYPGLKPGAVPIGIECSGRVSAVGEGVELAIGDEVAGIAPFCFASHATTHALAVVPKPKSVSFEEAATIPIAFLTAHYALIELARLQPGEKVLIHAAAGGVGLAAIQIAQSIGAEIFATAGSDEKRAYLQSLGVEHVYSSRTLDFADQIRAETSDAGVDVVLNSLPGEAITKSIECLGSYGRFLEIGKTDIYQNKSIGLFPFQNNLSYFAIDLDKMLRERPEVVRRMFLEVIDGFDKGTYDPLPATVFSAEESGQAFRYMAQRKNTGKVVVSLVRSAEADGPPGIRSDGSYWITGGLGAIGLELAGWLADRGASRLVLFGRSSPSEGARQILDRLRVQGVETRLVQVDLADREGLQRAIASMPSVFARPIGVFHTAGVLDDGILHEQSRGRFERVLRPKIDGAWNVHEMTLDAPLDHFVLFSSVASIFGSPGQGNYAAGNAFLDGLSQYRRSKGLPALTINWGPWAEIGMAARLADDKMGSRGIHPMAPRRALEAFERLLESAATQATVIDADWNRMAGLYPDGPPAFIADLADGAPAADNVDEELRQRLLATPMEDRLEFLKNAFVDQIARVTELDPARIDPDQPLTTLGIDSLMAIELKNGIESSLSVNLPMAKFLEGPSAQQLAQLVMDLMPKSGSGDVSAVVTDE